MKSPLVWLLAITAIVFVIGGFFFLDVATAGGLDPGARTPALAGGLGCLTLATGLLCYGLFAVRKRG